MRRWLGFTLIEVMVAMIIVSVALPALVMQMGSMSNAAFRAQETMLAHWVAENKMQEIYLTQRLQKIVPRGRAAGDIEMGGRVWDWQVEERAVEEFPGFHQIWVRISPQGGDVAAEITGFYVD